MREKRKRPPYTHGCVTIPISAPAATCQPRLVSPGPAAAPCRAEPSRASCQGSRAAPAPRPARPGPAEPYPRDGEGLLEVPAAHQAETPGPGALQHDAERPHVHLAAQPGTTGTARHGPDRLGTARHGPPPARPGPPRAPGPAAPGRRRRAEPWPAPEAERRPLPEPLGLPRCGAAGAGAKPRGTTQPQARVPRCGTSGANGACSSSGSCGVNSET